MTGKLFISVIVPLFILVPIITGAIKFTQLPASVRLLWYYLVATALINTAATIVGRGFHTNNMPILHLFTLLEGLMLFWFYQQITDPGKMKNGYKILLAAYFLTCLLNAAFIQSIYVYSSYTRYLESIICMLFALNYFARIAALGTRPLEAPLFYFNAGIFLYFSGSFVLFIFSNVILQKLPPSTMLIFWTIHSSFVMVMYLLFSTGFILCKK